MTGLPPDEQDDLSSLTFAAWQGAFTAGEADMVEALGERLAPEKASLIGDTHDSTIRITETAWIQPGPETQWIFNRLQAVARALNDKVWRFDISAFSEPLQYTVYRGAEGGHYGWHVDQGRLHRRRKLSFTLQLSAPSGYRGGDLELHGNEGIQAGPRERGTVIAFPSYVLHRVTPVTAGTRKSLVAWTWGPRFR